MAVRGHVQPQWTVAATIPMIILLYNHIQEDKKLKSYALRFFIPTLAMLLIGRVVISENKFVANVCGFEKEWPQVKLISKTAGELPVLFHGSFQEASKYHYFTSKNAFPLSSIEGRYTQFDIWQSEKQYHNKPVFVCDSIYGHSTKISDGVIAIHGFIADSLQTVNRMIVDFDNPGKLLSRGDTIVMKILVHNPYPYTVDFHHKQFPVKLSAVFIHKGKRVFQPARFDTQIDLVEAGNTVKREVSFTVPKLKPGSYQLGFSLRTILSNPLNSRLVKTDVEYPD